MYESTYSADWSDLTRDEAVERAYALGVASACGHDNTNEYKAITAAAASSYDRSLVELSFEQGQADARQLEAPDTEADEIWDELIESTTITPPENDTALPELLDSAELLERFNQLEGPPAALNKPSFLLRDKKDNE